MLDIGRDTCLRTLFNLEWNYDNLGLVWDQELNSWAIEVVVEPDWTISNRLSREQTRAYS